jgi:hypothetical protein
MTQTNAQTDPEPAQSKTKFFQYAEEGKKSKLKSLVKNNGKHL